MLALVHPRTDAKMTKSPAAFTRGSGADTLMMSDLSACAVLPLIRAIYAICACCAIMVMIVCQPALVKRMAAARCMLF